VTKEQLWAALITAAEALDLGCAAAPGYNPLTPQLLAAMEKQNY
jgi:hypothetical protein